MDAKTLQLMNDQVRAIYRALTGQELPDDPPAAARLPDSSPAEVARVFAELDTLARQIPQVAERVPPFSFAPPLDAVDTGRELLIEVGVPGIEARDVRVELAGDTVTITGVRAGERGMNGRTYYHQELPRGPFHRVVGVPFPVVGEPRVEVERGLISVHLTKATKAAPARA
jgi:HSP20 family molecular chaperone IbpA